MVNQLITIKVEFKPAGGLTPERLQQLLGRNIKAGINLIFHYGREIVRGRVPRNSSGRHSARLYETVDLNQAKVSTHSAELLTTNPIWVFYEEDTKAHIIQPKNAKALHFFMGGNEVFATRVHHPGTKGHHYWKEADEYIGSMIGPVLGLAVTAALAGQDFTSGATVSTAGPAIVTGS
jgi:hypothetical protein